MTLRKIIFTTVMFFGLFATSNLFSQKVAFISSDMIREKFPEAMQAQQRIQSMVEDWKRQLKFLQQKIDALEFEIKKNRLIWTEQEKAKKEKELQDLLSERELYAKSKFEPGGEYDQITFEIMKPVEEKIHASVQQVAADVGFDIIFDQSTQPLAYVNYKYDLTLRVLRNLGVDTKELEAELQEKISADPRNEQKRSKTPRRGRGRNNPDEKPDEEKLKEEEERGIIPPDDPQLNEIKNPGSELEKIEPEKK